MLRWFYAVLLRWQMKRKQGDACNNNDMELYCMQSKIRWKSKDFSAFVKSVDYALIKGLSPNNVIAKTSKHKQWLTKYAEIRRLPTILIEQNNTLTLAY
tara:strand:- start:7368 stop:7664 length:297 start_codon:yes stop_codon:yes gene_type:complete